MGEPYYLPRSAASTRTTAANNVMQDASHALLLLKPIPSPSNHRTARIPLRSWTRPHTWLHPRPSHTRRHLAHPRMWVELILTQSSCLRLGLSLCLHLSLP